jgi:hypothetical protein
MIYKDINRRGFIEGAAMGMGVVATAFGLSSNAATANEAPAGRPGDERPLTVIFSFLSRADNTPDALRYRGKDNIVGPDGTPLKDPVADAAKNGFEPDPNLNFEHWGEYWRKVHGPRFTYPDGTDQANLAQLLRYDQIHRIAAGPTNLSPLPYAPPLDQNGKLFPAVVGHVEPYKRPQWDGVAYLNFATAEDIRAVLGTERVQKKISPEDHALFRDVAPMLARQFIVKPSATSNDPILLVRIHVRKPELDRDAFQSRWLVEHSAVVLAAGGKAGLIRRYVQLHNIGATTEGKPFYHPQVSQFDGVSLFAFSSLNDLESFMVSDAWQAILQHERGITLNDQSEYWTALNVTVVNQIQMEVATSRA